MFPRACHLSHAGSTVHAFHLCLLTVMRPPRRPRACLAAPRQISLNVNTENVTARRQEEVMRELLAGWTNDMVPISEVRCPAVLSLALALRTSCLTPALYAILTS